MSCPWCRLVYPRPVVGIHDRTRFRVRSASGGWAGVSPFPVAAFPRTVWPSRSDSHYRPESRRQSYDCYTRYSMNLVPVRTRNHPAHGSLRASSGPSPTTQAVVPVAKVPQTTVPHLFMQQTSRANIPPRLPSVFSFHPLFRRVPGQTGPFHVFQSGLAPVASMSCCSRYL